MDHERIALLLDRRLSGAARSAAVHAIVRSDEHVTVLADSTSVLVEMETHADAGENGMQQGALQLEVAAEREMFADIVADALVTGYPGVVRAVHRVVLARMLRDQGAAALVAGLDAVREVAARGEARDVALEAFVWALTRGEPGPLPPGFSPNELAAQAEAARARTEEVGPDAYLLERIAADREAYAADAAGIDSEEAARARQDAEQLRTLAIRHAVQYARARKGGR